MTDHGVHVVIAQCLHQGQHIVHQLRHVAGAPVALIAVVAACCKAIPTLIGCDHMKTGLRQGDKLMPPAVGQFGKTV